MKKKMVELNRKLEALEKKYSAAKEKLDKDTSLPNYISGATLAWSVWQGMTDKEKEQAVREANQKTAQKDKELCDFKKKYSMLEQALTERDRKIADLEKQLRKSIKAAQAQPD